MSYQHRHCFLWTTFAVGTLCCYAAEASTNGAIDVAVRAWAKTDMTPSLEYALVDLNDDGISDAVVLVNDPRYCGSGGRTMLILVGTSSGFMMTSASTIVRAPISVLPKRRFNWHTIAVQVAGGGGRPGTRLLRFNGKRYPGSPTMAPSALPEDLVGASALKLIP
jgi:hypothetical protein